MSVEDKSKTEHKDFQKLLDLESIFVIKQRYDSSNSGSTQS